MKKSKVEILESYALGKATTKWIPEGGDILKRIGTEMILVKFSKETGEWKTENVRVFILGISGYDAMTGTYEIKYRELGGDDKEDKVETERIIPEGFSFNQPEKDLWMHRFMPYSLHMALTEEEIYYTRLREIFNSRPGLGIDEIRTLAQGNQSESLGYHNYIAAVIDSDIQGGLGQGMISFRIYGLGKIQLVSGGWSLGVMDKDSNYFQVRLETDQEKGGTVCKGFTIDGKLIGDLKILDIEDPKA
jgi:hypothetical protein